MFCSSGTSTEYSKAGNGVLNVMRRNVFNGRNNFLSERLKLTKESVLN